MKKLIILSISLFCFTANARIIGVAEAKGIFIKDKIEVLAFDDPDISGITCYTTYYNKALSFEESSSVSLSCRKTGKISGNITTKKNIFSISKSIFFKKTVVDRFFDQKRQVLVYLTYTKNISGNNASNSISIVVIN